MSLTKGNSHENGEWNREDGLTRPLSGSMDRPSARSPAFIKAASLNLERPVWIEDLEGIHRLNEGGLVRPVARVDDLTAIVLRFLLRGEQQIECCTVRGLLAEIDAVHGVLDDGILAHAEDHSADDHVGYHRLRVVDVLDCLGGFPLGRHVEQLGVLYHLRLRLVDGVEVRVVLRSARLHEETLVRRKVLGETCDRQRVGELREVVLLRRLVLERHFGRREDGLRRG